MKLQFPWFLGSQKRSVERSWTQKAWRMEDTWPFVKVMAAKMQCILEDGIFFLFHQQIASSPGDKYMLKGGKFSIPVKVEKAPFFFK